MILGPSGRLMIRPTDLENRGPQPEERQMDAMCEVLEMGWGQTHRRPGRGSYLSGCVSCDGHANLWFPPGKGLLGADHVALAVCCLTCLENN